MVSRAPRPCGEQRGRLFFDTKLAIGDCTEGNELIYDATIMLPSTELTTRMTDSFLQRQEMRRTLPGLRCAPADQAFVITYEDSARSSRLDSGDSDELYVGSIPGDGKRQQAARCDEEVAAHNILSHRGRSARPRLPYLLPVVYKIGKANLHSTLTNRHISSSGSHTV